MKKHWTPLCGDDARYAKRWADLTAWLEHERDVLRREAAERVPGSAGQQDRVARAEMAGAVLAKMDELRERHQ